MESESAFWLSPCGPSLPSVDGVSIRLFKRRSDADVAVPAERPDVRQYRYLLGTAEVGALEGLHRDSLAALDPLVRGHILRTAQDRLLSGRELTVDDIPAMAHLVAAGEVRTPGILVSALTQAALERLAHFVVTHASAAPLLEGYGAWDGHDPDPRRSATRLAPPVGPAGVAPTATPQATPQAAPPAVPQAARRVARQHA